MKGLLLTALLFAFLGLSVESKIRHHQNVRFTWFEDKDHWPYQHSYLKLPDSLFKENQFDSAFFYYEHAAKLFHNEGNYEGMIKCQNMIALKYQLDYRLDTAIVILNNLLESVQNKVGSAHPEIARTHFILGQCFDLKGNAEKALEEHDRALKMRVLLHGKDHAEVAKSYNGIGEVYLFTKRDYFNAEIYFYQSLEVWEMLNLSPSKPLAKTYYNLASANRLNEDYEKALIYANQALQTYRELAQNTQRFILNCLSLLANIYHDKKDWQSAERLYLQGLEYLNKNHPLTSYQIIQRANYHKDLGVVLTKRGQHKKARYHYDEALKTYEPERHQLAISFCYLNLGISLTQLSKFDSATYFLKKSLDLRVARYGKKHPSVSHNLRFIGDLYRSKHLHFKRKNDLDSALLYYQKALLAASKSFNADENIYLNPKVAALVVEDAMLLALKEKGNALKMAFHAFRDQRSLTVALDCFNLALRIIELNRLSFEQEGSKLISSETYNSVFESALDCLFLLYTKSRNKQYLIQAFNIMEQSKSKLILESFNKIHTANEVGIPDSILALENNLKADLIHFRKQLSNENSEVNANSPKTKRLKQNIFQTVRQQELLKESLALLYPSYYQIKYEADLKYIDIQDHLINTESQLLEFFWGDSAIYAISIDPKISQFQKFDKKNVESEIFHYYNQLIQGPQFSNSKWHFDTFCENAFAIYEHLISSFLDADRGYIKKLVLVLDGPLRHVPFESLITNRDSLGVIDYSSLSYLINKYQISYAYTANLWARKNSKTKKRRYKFLAFGYSDAKEFAGSTNNSSLEIPGSGRELEAISRHMKGRSYISDEATEQNFKEQAPFFDIIHLAIHGISDSIDSNNNRLLFNEVNRGPEDGVLYSHEIYNLSLNTSLVVLTACESGKGRDFKGEGIYSIARGFAYAGCPNTILSLWKIDDKATPLIVGEFYRYFSRSKNIDEALRLAKLNYINTSSGNLAHPSNWAPLVIVGSNNLLVSNSPIPVVILVMIAGLISFLILRKRF